MDLPVEVVNYLSENGYGEVVESLPASGGCIHNGRRLLTGSGRSVFLKTNTSVPPDVFSTEAEGLRILASPGSLRIPMVLSFGTKYLLLEDLAPASPRGDYWTALGHGLAKIHQVNDDQFGFTHDNYLGSTRQPNPRQSDGYAFFAENRLLYQAKMALSRALISTADFKRVEKVAARLPEWIPQQPASLIHGDLWSGNIIADSEGQPALIDPAAHYGWQEADLAMMVLFGSPPTSFYAAYDEVEPLSPGYQARFPVYNLYHLLNHVNIFGRGYLSQVRAVLARFA